MFHSQINCSPFLPQIPNSHLLVLRFQNDKVQKKKESVFTHPPSSKIYKPTNEFQYLSPNNINPFSYLFQDRKKRETKKKKKGKIVWWVNIESPSQRNFSPSSKRVNSSSFSRTVRIITPRSPLFSMESLEPRSVRAEPGPRTQLPRPFFEARARDSTCHGLSPT